MKAFNRKRLIISSAFGILIILLIVLINSDIFTYSRYESHVVSQNDITTAVYLLSDEYQTINVKLPDVLPENDQYTYSFSVNNFNEDAHCDTNLKYRIHVRTTTNLHIDYDLFDSLDINNANSVITSNSISSDRDGTYFRNIYTDYKTMLYSEDKTDNYTIVFTFPENNGDPDNPENYRESKYSGIPELIEITIESQQIIAGDT